MLLRTAEHPPTASSITNAFTALLAAIGEERARTLITDMIIPQIIDIDFADVYPLREPLSVLTDLLTQDGATEVGVSLRARTSFSMLQPIGMWFTDSISSYDGADRFFELALRSYIIRLTQK